MKKLFRLFKRKKTGLHYETLVNPKPRIGLQRVYKISVFVALLLCANISKSQISIDMGAGYNAMAQTSLMQLQVQGEKNNVVMGFKLDFSLTRKINSPNYYGPHIGYDIAGSGLIASVGGYSNYASADDKSKNGFVGLGYTLRYNYNIGEQGGLFIETMYVDKSVLASAGFHVVF